MYRVEYSGTVWYSLVPAVVSSLQSEVCSLYTSPTSHHPTRPEDQEDGGRIINKIYISLSLSPGSLPARPALADQIFRENRKSSGQQGRDWVSEVWEV